MGRGKNVRGKREAISQSRDDEADVDDDEPIWHYNDLKRSHFYAAAFFFHLTKPMQSTEYIQSDDAPADPNNQDNPKDMLLDHVALLFARYRQCKNMEDGTGTAYKTASNVTATALQRVPQSPDQNREDYIVWIAKNDGPQDFDNIKDEEMKGQLNIWLDSLTTSSRPDEKDEIWKSLQTFWRRRSNYYFDQLRDMREKWLLANKYVADTLPNDVLQFYEDSGVESKHIQSDWQHALNLLEKVRIEPGQTSGHVECFVNHICFKDSIAWQANYPKIHASGAPKLVSQFRRVIHTLRLLQTPKLVMEGLLQFRKENNDARIRLELLRSRAVPYLLAGPIIHTINMWRGEKNNSDEKAGVVWGKAKSKTKFREHTNQVLKYLKNSKSKGIHRRFHCELQLLEKFIEADDVHGYFGGSKYSCHLCWGVLHGSRFRTKGTHGKIHPEWAFPFSLSLEEGKSGEKNEEGLKIYKRLAGALKNMEVHLVGRINEKAQQADYNITDHPAITDTDPGPIANTSAPGKPEQQEFKEGELRRVPRISYHGLIPSAFEKELRLPENHYVKSTPETCPTPILKKGQRTFGAVQIPQAKMPKNSELLLQNRLDRYRLTLPRLETNEDSFWVTDAPLDQLSGAILGYWVRKDLRSGFFLHVFLVDGELPNFAAIPSTDVSSATAWILEDYNVNPVFWHGTVYLSHTSIDTYPIYDEICPREYLDSGNWQYTNAEESTLDDPDPALRKINDLFRTAKVINKKELQEINDGEGDVVEDLLSELEDSTSEDDGEYTWDSDVERGSESRVN